MEVEEKLIEWINSNRNNKTRLIFEMQDKEDLNKTYSFTLGNLFDIAFKLGQKQADKIRSENHNGKEN